MIQNIIFDFGGIILKHRSTIMEEMVAQIFSIPIKQAEEIWKREKPLIMTGKKSSKQFLKELKDQLHSDLSEEEILKLWKDLYIGHAEDVDLELLEFINKLKNKYRVYLFTDTIDSNDEYNSSRGIYDKFTRVFKSNEEGFTKLTDDAFINVLRKIKADPQDCIFIDDLEVNIKRAERLGIKGIFYKDQEMLKKDLSEMGIID